MDHVVEDRLKIFERFPFSPSEDEPIDRWLQLAMGWDVRFARYLIEELAPANCTMIIDPFAGCGASCLAAQRLNISAAAIDAASVCVTATYGKTHASYEDRHLFNLPIADQFPKSSDAGWLSELAEMTREYPLSVRAVVATSAIDLNRPGRKGSLRDRLRKVMADLELQGPAMNASSVSVRWGDASDADAWDWVRDISPIGGSWLVLGSPPHPGSRGFGLALGLAESRWCVDLAREIGSCGEVSGSGVAKVSLMMERITQIAPRPSRVVLEYECREINGIRSCTFPASIADRGRPVRVIRHYVESPDGKGGMVEGGVIVIDV